MPEYLQIIIFRIIFAEKRMMETKRDFKTITPQIKKEILSLGYGTIKLNKDIDDLWIDDYENYLSVSIHVNSISIDFDIITFYEDGNSILTFDHVYSIDRQIQIYETIYDHRDQLSYYQLDWSNYFKALRVEDEEGKTVWRILTSEEARHLWYNGRWCDMCQLYDDGTEGMIEDEDRLNECVNNGYDIGIPIS